MSEDVRVAIIGLGRVSGGHVEGWQECDSATIAAICDAEENRIAAALKEYDLGDMLASTDYSDLLAEDGIDAVDICLPDHLHRDCVLAAARAGKHILCEKPLGMTASEAQEMLQAVQAAKVTHQVRLQRRYSRILNYARHLVEIGAFGSLRHFRCRLSVHRISDPDVKLEWRLQKEKGCYGVLGDLGAHAIDQGFFVMGEAAGDVVEACAMAAIFIDTRELEDEQQTGDVTGYDAINFSLRYERNVLGSYQLSRFAPGTDKWELDGQEASMRVDGFNTDAFMWFEKAPKDDQVPASEFVERTIPEDFPTFPSEFDAFAQAVQEGKPATPDFNDGVRVAGVLDDVAAAAGTAPTE